MRRKILMIVLLMILYNIGLKLVVEEVSRNIVDHKEAGNFLNSEDLDLSRVTMLHWFGKEVQIYSDKDRDLYFAIIEANDNYVLYKNKEIIIQTLYPDLTYYQKGDFIVYDISHDDYRDHRVDLYSEVRLSDKKSQVDTSYFVGTHEAIVKLLVVKKTIGLVSVILLSLSVLMYIYINKKNRISIALAIAVMVLFVHFQIGLYLTVTIIFLMSMDPLKRDIVKNDRKRYIFVRIVVLLLAGVSSYLLSLDIFNMYLLILLLESFLTYYRHSKFINLNAFITLNLIWGIVQLDLEFNVFRVFNCDTIMIVLIIFMQIDIMSKLAKCREPETLIEVDLLRGISHDLRLPISTIKLNADLLSKNDFISEMNKGRIMNIIHGALEDLTHMTLSLTNYISNDHYVDKKYITNIQDGIHRTTAYFTNNSKHIEIKKELCEKELYLPIDDVWLNRLIYNLIDNACKYTDEYGEITIKLTCVKKRIVLSVRDNGIGMTDEQIRNVLKPFYRVDKSRNISGLGLGLSIVKAIVDNLGGSILITSKYSEYTEFTITI